MRKRRPHGEPATRPQSKRRLELDELNLDAGPFRLLAVCCMIFRRFTAAAQVR